MSRCLLAVCLAASLLAGLSSPAEAGPASPPKLVTVTYPVADVVVPIDMSPVVVTICKEAKVERPCRKEVAPTTEQQLVQLITSTLSPTEWCDKGGRGTVDYYPLTMSLVVTQTPQVQEQVRHLLSA